MGSVIYKYDLIHHKVTMPDCAEFLDVQIQNDRPVLWAKVSLSNPMREYEFIFVATGEQIEDGYRYIGTVQQGGLVWHLFVIRDL